VGDESGGNFREGGCMKKYPAADYEGHHRVIFDITLAFNVMYAAVHFAS